jgi:class 3 adenylate cyclase
MLKGKWKDAMETLRVKKYNYFKQFIPNVAISKLQAIHDAESGGDAEPSWSRSSKAPPLEAENGPCVILQVDISGFTRLSDRFQDLGQEGIDKLTTTINRMFGLIINHVESWGGDIVKFAGDAVIVVWPCTEETTAELTLKALTCAMELERLHGIFNVSIPDVKVRTFADQIARHFANAVRVDGDGDSLGNRFRYSVYLL